MRHRVPHRDTHAAVLHNVTAAFLPVSLALSFLSMYPYHIENQSSVELYQLSDGRFQITKHGDLSDFIMGHKYILIKNDIVSELELHSIEGVAYEVAIILDRRSNLEIISYKQLTINRHFESSDLNNINLEGSQFLVMDNRHLFVTPSLYGVLSNLDVGFMFSKGFGNFG